jgi:hypothetical protein
MSVGRVAEFEIDVEHGLAFVAAELLESDRVDAALGVSAQRAALEAAVDAGWNLLKSAD